MIPPCTWARVKCYLWFANIHTEQSQINWPYIHTITMSWKYNGCTWCWQTLICNNITLWQLLVLDHWFHIQKAVEVYHTIQKLTKKIFILTEDAILQKKWPLDKQGTPTFELCRRITECYDIQRTAKQPQDRWLTLFKKAI